jgi:hypothetical protein
MKKLLASFVVLCALLLYGCSGGTHSRGLFEGTVMGQTETAVTERYGKPDTSDVNDDKKHKLTYKTRTFDPDNANRVDTETIVTFEKNKDGQFVATAVAFL